ncbi:receptor-type tyrosine-protein phosphatase N2-like isoform X5 [Zerene cesonia]|uniref:receptor-type tyrosine-protein phosphatase N2-like isoform X5 n=1 Tax=Zerene cesonia TaxID=33412 RepID=UPI0018E53FC6|nr:receptor-type tyrosine-protein phosphatase N2-like isoform X5 [Zerene cesonia]
MRSLSDVMCRMYLRPTLWALALLGTLAPSNADGNIGCLFSSTLCVEGAEWCYDDFAFGKCIPIYESDAEEGSLYQYDMSSTQLQWFEGELQRLATQGYRWEHAYTQCVLQSMLYALRQQLDPTNVNSKLCDQFADPKLSSVPVIEGDENLEVEPDETAYVRFMPNSQLVDSDYANEIYNPPLTPDDEPVPYLIPEDHEVPSGKPSDINNNEYQYDPSYAFVKFQNRFLTNWEKGISFISRLEEMLGLEKDTFTNPRVDPTEVTFKVENNNRGWNAEEVARQIGAIKDKVAKETGAQIIASGIGDRTQYHVMRQDVVREPQYFGLELPVLLALVGSLAVLIVGVVIFAILLKRDMSSKRKMQGLSSAAEIDAEATRDYQVELCRARMSGKMTGKQAPAPHTAEAPQRITSLSREPDGNSPSTRSSTSSWSEEPALTNMDISTGHMVLAYMEDHLRNKDRLEQEWKALCAYEAEPNTTTAAYKADNTGKNRYSHCLPYDHARVTLNPLSNHLGSDYINASTITDHDPRNPAYIAASGPMPHTSSDFWQMVWEQGSVVMVMLTRLTENGQQLCHRYWPEEGSELYHIYEVHLVSEHIWCDDYLVRSFYLKNQQTSETRTVTQFHFLSWPENGVPSSTKALLEFRRKVNKSYRGRSCPIVVHCSDGAGRTGTYCLIDMVLNRMAKGAKEIDIAATLEHIRDQRPRMVATKQQFEFVLMAVAEEVHAILKALPAHLQQLQEKKEKEKEKDKDGSEKEKHN